MAYKLTPYQFRYPMHMERTSDPPYIICKKLTTINPKVRIFIKACVIRVMCHDQTEHLSIQYQYCSVFINKTHKILKLEFNPTKQPGDINCIYPGNGCRIHLINDQLSNILVPNGCIDEDIGFHVSYDPDSKNTIYINYDYKHPINKVYNYITLMTEYFTGITELKWEKVLGNI